jgi:hypothetical protein
LDRDATPVADARGELVGHLDFRAAEHIEVVLLGGHGVRVGRAHFEGQGAGSDLRLKTRAEAVFAGRVVTTIDGIDIGKAVAVARGPGGTFEAIVLAPQGEAGALAVPFEFVREVSAHIILEPSEEEVRNAQGRAHALPGVAQALARAARGGPPQR